MFNISIVPQCVVAGEGRTRCYFTNGGGLFAFIANDPMTDNGDGTYSFTFTPRETGIATVLIDVLTDGGLRTEF